MMNKRTRRGFTLPEVLLSTVLSVMVFFALGTLLSRSFSVWYDGMAQWKLATHARVTRTRLLDGGFGKGTGLLSATNHTINPYGNWEYLEYYPILSGEKYRSYGWIPTNSPQNIWLNNEDPLLPVKWAYGQNVGNAGNTSPDVKVGGFDAEFVEDDVLELTYTLYFSAGGKTNEHPQTIRVVLLNSE